MSLRCGHVDSLCYIFSRSEQGEDRGINAFGICPNRRALVLVSLARILFGLRIFTLDALTQIMGFCLSIHLVSIR